MFFETFVEDVASFIPPLRLDIKFGSSNKLTLQIILPKQWYCRKAANPIAIL
jgi:hypothetical protein